MSVPTVDLNADLGESFGRWRLGDDVGLLRVVTSANVACGFHAGDPATLVETCRLAVEHGVVIGAQVGYRNLAGFGRRFIDVEPVDLFADVLYQISALDGIARSVGGRVAYVKPHGALYNAVVHHESQARAVAAAVAAHTPGMPVLGLPGSALLACAEGVGLRPVAEVFADRAYLPDGGLVSRREPGAALQEVDAVVARVCRLVTEGVIETVTGSLLTVDAESICLDGDTPGAVSMAVSVRAALTAAGVSVLPFTVPLDGWRLPRARRGSRRRHRESASRLLRPTKWWPGLPKGRTLARRRGPEVPRTSPVHEVSRGRHKLDQRARATRPSSHTGSFDS